MQIDKNSYQPQPLTLYSVMARFLCLCVGHKISDTTDSGYNYCTRCAAHEYWDTKEYNSNKWSNAGYLLKPIYWVRWQYNLMVSNLKIRFRNEMPF